MASFNCAFVFSWCDVREGGFQVTSEIQKRVSLLEIVHANEKSPHIYRSEQCVCIVMPVNWILIRKFFQVCPQATSVVLTAAFVSCSVMSEEQ